MMRKKAGGIRVPKALDRVLDALDVETFFLCDTREEGVELGLKLMKELGFDDVDVVFCEQGGPGVRIRLRAYLSRPGSDYPWTGQHDAGEAKTGD